MKSNFIGSLPKGLLEDVAKFLAKEPTKAETVQEEVEQIDEISKDTLRSYVTKAADQYKEKMNSSEDLERRAKKLTSYVSKHNYINKAYKQREDANKRRTGIANAMKTLVGEEVEFDYAIVSEEFGVGDVLDITESTFEVMFEHGIETINSDELVFEEIEDLQELSKDTLKSYTQKASADPAFDKKKGKPSKKTVAIRAKRTAGVEKAKEKLTAILRSEADTHEKNMLSHTKVLHKHFHNEAPKILAKHGYTKLASHEHRDTYVKAHDNGHVTTVTLGRHAPRYGGDYGPEYNIGGSKGSYGSVHAHTGVYDDKGAEKHRLEMMPNFESNLIKAHERHSSDHHY